MIEASHTHAGQHVTDVYEPVPPLDAGKWRPVVGWEDLYEVSDQGHVCSLERYVPCGPKGKGRRKISRKILKPTLKVHKPSGKKYRVVTLTQSDRREWTPVSWLVLTAFRSARPSGFWALHRNDNSIDDRLENLYWGTPGQNNWDAVINGHNHYSRRTHDKYGNELDGVIRRGGRIVGRYSTVTNRNRKRVRRGIPADWPKGKHFNKRGKKV